MPEQPISLSPSVAGFLDTSRRYFGLAGTHRAVERHGQDARSGFAGSFTGRRVPLPLAVKA